MKGIRPCSEDLLSLPMLRDKLLTFFAHFFESSCSLARPQSLRYKKSISFISRHSFCRAIVYSILQQYHPEICLIMLFNISSLAFLITSLIFLNFGNAQFVTTNGLEFELNGKPYSFAGANSWTSQAFQTATTRLH